MSTQDLPEFLVDELADLDPGELRSVVAYIEEERITVPDDVPENVFTALSLQDEETVSTVAAVAREFADRKERGDAVTDLDDGSETSESHEIVRRVGDSADASDAAGHANDETDGDWWEDRFY
jgi:hypothetical protein